MDNIKNLIAEATELLKLKLKKLERLEIEKNELIQLYKTANAEQQKNLEQKMTSNLEEFKKLYEEVQSVSNTLKTLQNKQ